MQAIKNLYQIKGGVDLATTESQDVQAEILRLYEEDRATYLLLYGENPPARIGQEIHDEVVFP